MSFPCSLTAFTTINIHKPALLHPTTLPIFPQHSKLQPLQPLQQHQPQSQLKTQRTTVQLFSTALALEDNGDDDDDDDEIAKKVYGYFKLWKHAMSTGEASLVASRYTNDAVLIPPEGNQATCNEKTSIKEYFAKILQDYTLIILDCEIRGESDDLALATGTYSLRKRSTGERTTLNFSITYTLERKQWKIAHHHIYSAENEGTNLQGEEGSLEPLASTSKTQVASTTTTTTSTTSSPTTATTTTAAARNMMEPLEVRRLFREWNDAMATEDSKVVTSLYSKRDVVLLPIFSNRPKTDLDAIDEYYRDFLAWKPQAHILHNNINIGTNWCQNTGMYELTMGRTGKKIRANFSFIYQRENNSQEWKITRHHSSKIIKQGYEAPPLPKTDVEVRALFELWKDALASLDAKTVAKRYTKRTIFLPAISDVPFTNPKAVQSYYEDFLEFRPTVQVLESDINIGYDWVMDNGIYEYTMQATGETFRSRYSFVYTYQDEEWKIAQHTSFFLPEELTSNKNLSFVSSSAFQ